ncbi:hypothetical protein AAC387_Pa08g1684 [Persea americana]
MALCTLSFTLPTFAAAAGVYFFNNHQNKAKHVESSSGSSTERNTMVGPKERQEKEEKNADRPRFAVELDGLNCFETIVAY